MKNFDSLKAVVLGAEEDALKFFAKGNGAAGRRLRIAMQQVKLLGQQIRVEVSEKKKKK
ncbi:histone H1 [Pedobacter sp. HDW13]|uniref:histone H1 n=1 Tax=Pedobacter sp. HDW13 TaxID=2714940 RepID=UPI00140D2CE2|nr:histone H1 [Pedobacter sp. HDW13]QIL42382.1 histone H1 [Pedobacter sp. HDW13]